MKKLLSLLLAAAMLFALAACNASVAGESENPAGEGSQKIEITDGIYPSLTVASADPEVLSPLILKRDGKNVVTELYETLCDINGWGGEFYGRLAKDWSWETRDDADVLKVEIYDYIYDSAGNHYTANDTKFCYLTDAEAGYFPEYGKYITEINVINDYNLEFICKPGTSDTVRATEDILACCLQYTQAAYEASADQMATTPVGTGPYTLVSFVPGSSVVIERSENYWQKDESLIHTAQKANIQRIEFVFMTENTQKVNALKTGEIDYASNISQDTLDYFNSSDDYNVLSWEKNMVVYMVPNCDTGKALNDINLRAAIFYAIDGQDIVDACGGDNSASRTYAFTIPSVRLYNKNWETQETYYTVSDLELAQKYLDKSSYNGETLKIVYEANGDYGDKFQACALVIGAALDKLGIKYEISSLDANSLTEMWNYDTGAWDMVIHAWGGTIGMISEFWFQIYSAAQFDKDGLGLGNWHDDTLYAMFEDLYTVSNSTQEKVDEFYDYEVENFYSYGLCQLKCYDVGITDISSTYMTQRMWFVPGAFEFKVN